MSPYFFHMNNHDYQYWWPHGEIPYTFLFCLLFLHINLFYFIELFFINGPNFVLVPRLNLSGDVYTNANCKYLPLWGGGEFFSFFCVCFNLPDTIFFPLIHPIINSSSFILNLKTSHKWWIKEQHQTVHMIIR